MQQHMQCERRRAKGTRRRRLHLITVVALLPHSAPTMQMGAVYSLHLVHAVSRRTRSRPNAIGSIRPVAEA